MAARGNRSAQPKCSCSSGELCLGMPIPPLPAAPRATLGRASRQGVLHRVDQFLILEHFDDAIQVGVPQFVPAGQHHFEDASLRVLTTYRGDSSDLRPADAPTTADGSPPPIAAGRAAVPSMRRGPAASTWPGPEARSSRPWSPRLRGNSRRDAGHACAPGGSGNHGGRKCDRFRRACRTKRAETKEGGGEGERLGWTDRP